LDQAELGDDVDVVEGAQRIEGIVGKARLRRRAECARVVHEEREFAQLSGRRDEGRPVGGVGDVAGDRSDSRRTREFGRGRVERVSAPRVEDQGPAFGGQTSCHREPESAGGAGDDCNLHGCPFRVGTSMRRHDYFRK
jgi:hypothetical protein